MTALLALAAKDIRLLLRNRGGDNPDTMTDEHRPRVFHAPATPFNGRLSAQRAVAMADVAFDDVKLIKDAFDTTVNDVVLAASCAGLRAWLLAHLLAKAGKSASRLTCRACSRARSRR